MAKGSREWGRALWSWKSQGLASGGTGDPMTALSLQPKVQIGATRDSNGFRFELAPEQEQAYKNSFNPYTNSIKSGKHTAQSAVCSRVRPCESATGRLQEISVKSGPGSSKPQHGPVASSPLRSLLFLFIFWIQKPRQ